MEYQIPHMEMVIQPCKNYSRGTVLLVFKRRIEFHVTNTIFQTLMLQAVGFLTLFFDVDNFTDRIMVTLTTMLVVATITTSIQEVNKHH